MKCDGHTYGTYKVEILVEFSKKLQRTTVLVRTKLQAYKNAKGEGSVLRPIKQCNN